MGMLYKRGAVWWIKYYRNGHGMRESSHSTKEGDARRLLKLREGDIEHGLPVAYRPSSGSTGLRPFCRVRDISSPS